MRDSSSDIVTSLQQAPSKGLVSLRFVSIWPRSFATGELVRFCFWSDPVPASFQVRSRLTGDLETRDFVGGVALSCAPLKISLGVRVRNWSFSLNGLHPVVVDMRFNHDLHGAAVEYHRVPGSTRSRRPVDDPPRRFFGQIDGAPQPVPEAGGTQSLQITCASITQQLTNTNPIKRSGIAQSRREGDQQMQYAAVADDWEIDWGQVSGGTK